jgi:hypothetical protein
MTEDTQEMHPMEQLIMDSEGDPNLIGQQISGVLEFLTIRAVIDKPYMILTEDETGMVLIAAGDAVTEIREALKDITIKNWEDPLDEEATFLTDQDPGDEQDEPATEQE